MPAAIEEHPTYCYLGGKRVPLTPAPRLIAVKMDPTKRIALSPEATKILKDRSSVVEFVVNYGVHIYDTENRDNALDVLRREAAIEVVNPVFVRDARVPGDYMFTDNRFVVQFKAGMNEEEIKQYNARHNVSIVEKLTYADNLFVLEAPKGSSAVALANLYHESGVTRSAEPNLIRQPRYRDKAAPRDTPSSTARATHADQWHLHTAKVIEAWTITEGSSSIKIAILDDGVDLGHPEFSSRVVAQFDFETGTADGTPKVAADKHGTACAGVATAGGVAASGVAPHCSLIAVRTPSFLGVADEGRMFKWAADEGADVISCSWGPTDGTGATDPLPSATQLAIDYCCTKGRGGKGIPIFWAAGNGDESVSLDGYASNPDVMAIAASTSNETRSYYSDFGPEVFICAPSSGRRSDGEKAIYTTDRRGSPGYNSGSASSGDAAGDYYNGFGGTSSATPLVAGVAGLILSVNPNLRVGEVRDILRQTAERIGSASEYDAQGHSNNFGYGRVNAFAAVQRAGGSGATAQPAITGPSTISRTAAPPHFAVAPGSNTFYVAEFAVSAEFDRSGPPSSFYGTWTDSPFLTASNYTLPPAKWDLLKAASQLFYRIMTSSSSTGWTNTQTSAQGVIQITASSGGGGAGSQPTMSGPPSVERTSSPPQFTIVTGSNPFYVVEFATTSAFDRTAPPSGHYGSWTDTPFLTAGQYTLPQAKWDLLKGASQLFYRVMSSSSNTGWTDIQTGASGSLQITAAAPPSGPSMKGPPSAARAAAPPQFAIVLGANPFYVVEFAINNQFDRAGPANSHYGSWTDTPFLTAGQYTLPQAKWDLLKGASQLFYRVLTSSSNTGWTNIQTGATAVMDIVTGRDSRDAPEDRTVGKGPWILGPVSHHPEDRQGPRFLIEAGANRFVAVEVAVEDPRLFYPRETNAVRTSQNFYGSWQDSLTAVKGRQVVYTLPERVWLNLMSSRPKRLYYRVLTTSEMRPDWPDYQAFPADAQYAEAPFIELSGRPGRTTDDARLRDAALWRGL